jgi:hypothetical protein
MKTRTRYAISFFNAIITPAFFIITLAAASCAGGQAVEEINLRFVVIGNTNPASPFKGFPEKIQQTFESINSIGPAFVVQTGGIIYGGTEKSGITRDDCQRQFRDYMRARSALRSAVYHSAGERDLFNSSVELFTHYTGSKPYYSFNYGSIHFIVLYVPSAGAEPDPEQLKWLKNDLHENRRSRAHFVFSHYPIIQPSKEIVANRHGEKFHAIIKEYPVIAAFSGHGRAFAESAKDGIRYISAGCFGFNMEDWHWNANQYYAAEYNGSDLTVTQKKVNFPQNSYRPVIIQPQENKTK